MLKLSEVMKRDVVTVTPTMRLLDVMACLSARHVSGAPVVDGGKVVGVISATDLIAYAVSLSGGKEQGPGTYFTDEPSGREANANAPVASAEDVNRSALERHTVAEAMTPWVHSLPPSASVIEAADEMQRSHIHRLLVMDHDRLAGIVSAIDIAEAVAQHRLTTRTYVFNKDQDFDERGA